VFSKNNETGGKGKMKKTEKVTNKVLKAIERVARNEVEKTILSSTAECSALFHQPKRPKKSGN
jgi:cyclic lactone autoinducer peptide